MKARFWILLAIAISSSVAAVSPARAATTERVSVSSAGEQANGDSWWPALSADGRGAVASEDLRIHKLSIRRPHGWVSVDSCPAIRAADLLSSLRYHFGALLISAVSLAADRVSPFPGNGQKFGATPEWWTRLTSRPATHRIAEDAGRAQFGPLATREEAGSGEGYRS